MKNDHFHEVGKVRRSNAIPTKLFSVVSCDLKSMSFKFGNAISNTFEMLPNVHWQIYILLQFRPSASDSEVLA